MQVTLLLVYVSSVSVFDWNDFTIWFGLVGVLMGTPRGRFSGRRSHDLNLFDYSVTDRLIVAGTTKLNLTTAQNCRTLLINPISSGKTVVVLKINVFANSEVFVEFYINPTGGLTTTSRLPNIVGSAISYSADTEFYSDVSSTPMSGGLKLDVVLGIGQVGEYATDIPFRLLPGISYGTNAIASGNTTMYMNYTWLEA